MKNLMKKARENKKTVLIVGAGVIGLGTILSTLLKRKKKPNNFVEYDEDSLDDDLFDNDLETYKSRFDEDEFDFWKDKDDEFKLKDYESYVQFSKLDNIDYKRNLIIAIDILSKELFETKHDILQSITKLKYDVETNKEEIISNLEHIEELSKLMDSLKEGK